MTIRVGSPGARRVLSVASRLLLAFGVVCSLLAVGTLVYGEIFERHQAWRFEQEIEEADGLPEIDVREFRADIRRGDRVARLEIPRLGVSVTVLHGVETEILRVGAGHVPGTPLPGGGGNTAIAGHRDTFFRKLEGIQPGDLIQVSTLAGSHEYTVDSIEIVGPGDTRVLESRARPELTLITCYPFRYVGAAPERFVVRARYVSR